MPTRAEAERIAQEDAMMRQIAMQAAQQRAQEQAFQRTESAANSRQDAQVRAAQIAADAQLAAIRAQMEGQRGIAADTRQGMIDLRKTPEAMSEAAREDLNIKKTSKDYLVGQILSEALTGQPQAGPLPTAQAPMQTAPSKPTRQPQPLPGEPGFRAWYKSKYGPGAEPSSSDIYDPNRGADLNQRVALARKIAEDPSIAVSGEKYGTRIDDMYSISDAVPDGMSIPGPNGTFIQIAKPGRDRSPVADVKAAMMPTPPIAGITGDGAAATVAPTPVDGKREAIKDAVRRSAGIVTRDEMIAEEDRLLDKDKKLKAEASKGAQSKAILDSLASKQTLTPREAKQWEDMVGKYAEATGGEFVTQMPRQARPDEFVQAEIEAFAKDAMDLAGGLFGYASDSDRAVMRNKAQAIKNLMVDAGYDQGAIQRVVQLMDDAMRKTVTGALLKTGFSDAARTGILSEY